MPRGSAPHGPRDVSPCRIRDHELHNGTPARSSCRVIAEFKGLLISGRQDRPEIESGVGVCRGNKIMTFSRAVAFMLVLAVLPVLPAAAQFGGMPGMPGSGMSPGGGPGGQFGAAPPPQQPPPACQQLLTLRDETQKHGQALQAAS